MDGNEKKTASKKNYENLDTKSSWANQLNVQHAPQKYISNVRLRAATEEKNRKMINNDYYCQFNESDSRYSR